MPRKVKQPHGGSITLAEKGDVLNPKGPTPKILSTVVKELKQAGYTRVGPSAVLDAFETLLDVPEDVLRELVNDKTKPMSLRIVAKSMLTAKGWEVLQAMLDRAHGKARQSTDITSGGEKIAAPIVGLQVNRKE